jgi:hypothetical protein
MSLGLIKTTAKYVQSKLEYMEKLVDIYWSLVPVFDEEEIVETINKLFDLANYTAHMMHVSIDFVISLIFVKTTKAEVSECTIPIVNLTQRNDNSLINYCDHPSENVPEICCQFINSNCLSDMLVSYNYKSDIVTKIISPNVLVTLEPSSSHRKVEFI